MMSAVTITGITLLWHKDVADDVQAISLLYITVFGSKK
jgi:hypothetical protein